MDYTPDMRLPGILNKRTTSSFHLLGLSLLLCKMDLICPALHLWRSKYCVTMASIQLPWQKSAVASYPLLGLLEE